MTVLQADGDFDAGPVWAHAAFDMRPATKGSLYRREVTRAALQATLAAVERFAGGERTAPPQGESAPDPAKTGTLPGLGAATREAAERGGMAGIPAMKQTDRAIDWSRDDTATVLAKLRCADGQPGVLDALWGQACYLGDAHEASAATLAEFAGRAPGELLAVRDGALLRRTVDGGVWIGQARLADPPGTARGPGPLQAGGGRAVCHRSGRPAAAPRCRWCAPTTNGPSCATPNTAPRARAWAA